MLLPRSKLYFTTGVLTIFNISRHQEKINDLLVAELAEAGEANLTFSRWCNYTVPLELILSKILEKASARRLRRRAEKPDGSRAKNFLP